MGLGGETEACKEQMILKSVGRAGSWSPAPTGVSSCREHPPVE